MKDCSHTPKHTEWTGPLEGHIKSNSGYPPPQPQFGDLDLLACRNLQDQEPIKSRSCKTRNQAIGCSLVNISRSGFQVLFLGLDLAWPMSPAHQHGLRRQVFQYLGCLVTRSNKTPPVLEAQIWAEETSQACSSLSDSHPPCVSATLKTVTYQVLAPCLALPECPTDMSHPPR